VRDLADCAGMSPQAIVTDRFGKSRPSRYPLSAAVFGLVTEDRRWGNTPVVVARPLAWAM